MSITIAPRIILFVHVASPGFASYRVVCNPSFSYDKKPFAHLHARDVKLNAPPPAGFAGDAFDSGEIGFLEAR